MKCPFCERDTSRDFALTPQQMTYLVALAHGSDVDALAERLGVLPSAPRSTTLTPRETQIAVMIAQGHGTQEIMDKLEIARSTFRNTLFKAYLKTGTHTRNALGAWATREGLV